MSHDKRIPDYYKLKPRYVSDVIDYVESIGDLHGFCRGNIIKYVVRAGKKTNTLEDLYKAREYINRWIASEEKDGEYSTVEHLDNDRTDSVFNDSNDGR